MRKTFQDSKVEKKSKKAGDIIKQKTRRNSTVHKKNKELEKSIYRNTNNMKFKGWSFYL